jgi:hypothetical protein
VAVKGRHLLGFSGLGKPAAEKKSVAPKSSGLILARRIALVSLLESRILTSKFSIKATPLKKEIQRLGSGKNLTGQDQIKTRRTGVV